MLGLAVREGQLDIINYLVTECRVSVNGEQSVNVSHAICGVCEHALPDTGQYFFHRFIILVTKRKNHHE